MSDSSPIDGIQRKWVLTKLGAGDYMLPSNSGQTIYRITRSEEEGWDLFQWADPVGMDGYVAVEDWSRWVCVAQQNDTRQEAIDEALRIGDNRA